MRWIPTTRRTAGTSDESSKATNSLGGTRNDSEELIPLQQRIARGFRRIGEIAREEPGRFIEGVASVVIVVLATMLVLSTLNPSELFANTTPTGGDMGAHVWGPRYLLDNLIPHGRVSGWTPDWYNGFPAYQFYMVLPSLAIVALHVGLPFYLAIPALIGLGALVWYVWSKPKLFSYRLALTVMAIVLAVLTIPVSYNQSFKIITAIGLLCVPAACWAFAKLSDFPNPTPTIAAAAGLLFIYNREPLHNNTGNIIGGNFHSTMAGEFAFSISLTLAILYLGVAAKGLKTGGYRALAAVLFALACLCHLIPAFFVIACLPPQTS